MADAEALREWVERERDAAETDYYTRGGESGGDVYYEGRMDALTEVLLLLDAGS